MLLLCLLAMAFLPYFALYPDRHAHVYDFHGTDRQRQMMVRWRAAYSRRWVWQRFGRWWKVWRRERVLARFGPRVRR